ncbi:MAG: ATP-binding cassette domain-containing protein [Spirochaetales bacterium]|nr:ATP-binding cassette domain-containing protein [Spirochaetales bacterium]
MISANDVTLRFGKRILFENVNIKFTEGNCYGLIGANGAGKSTFLKVLSGEIEADKGDIVMSPGSRMAVLKQDHFQFDEYKVLDVIVMGHEQLYKIMKERDELYAKEEMTDEDGMRIAELESEFAELNGWEAESEAGKLLNGLGLADEYLEKKMSELEGGEKIRVLLAQALFGNPDILLLDEPTNHLDLNSIQWLENFLIDFDNTVIVVSHDRHFLNRVCTHIADIDFGKITLFVGNYDFWHESSQLILKQIKNENKKKEEKIKELKDFIQRFASNAAKSRQATSRKKVLDTIKLDEMRASSRKFPYVAFKADREPGNEILIVDGLTKTIDGRKVLNNVSFTVQRDDKIAFVGPDGAAKTALFRILMGEDTPDSGEFKWGQTITKSYFPKDNGDYFDGCDLSLVDWLRQYSKDQEETFVRSFLGRMLFSGEESLKSAKVLSGGERVRCMLSKLMLSGANFLILDEPTNHLDLESITSLNEGLIDFKGNVLFVSQDHQFMDSIANRIIEITPNGIIDKMMKFDEYMYNEEIAALREKMYK